MNSESSDAIFQSCDDQAGLQIGDLIDERFRILEVPSCGGMSAVYAALDTQFGKKCAVKIALATNDRARADLSFVREEKALRDLSHPNIARYIESGKFNGKMYLVLEWLPGGSLAETIVKRGPMSWTEFYEEIGRPILTALSYAHQRDWAHRDLKPQNIIFDADEVPKIIDFGIAREVTQPQINNTLCQSGSPPYTPSESDDGYRSPRRDVYSWVAIAVSCMTGKIFHDFESLNDGLESLGSKAVPKEAMLKGLSSKISDRQEAANILLADTDTFHAAALNGTQRKIAIFFQSPSETIVRELQSHYATIAPEDVASFIEKDFSSTPAASFDPIEEVLVLVGSTIRAMCRIDQTSIKLMRLTVHSPDRASELRTHLHSISTVVFSFGYAKDLREASGNIRSLISRLEMAEDISFRISETQKLNYWFDCWSDFLREKERLYKNKKLTFSAERIESDGELYAAALEGDVTREMLGESLVLPTKGGKPLIFSIVDFETNLVSLNLKSGTRSDIPFGRVIFESNFEAERKSIQKQRAALDEIRSGSAVSPIIGAILSQPENAAIATVSGLEFPKHLSLDKQQVLDKALGIESILAVNGPPGTGKTTLIAELIGAYLLRYPTRRILLSSQTHVALDHIILKLTEKNLSKNVVRIMSSGAENLHKINRLVAPLLLQNRVREWCVQAELRSENFIEQYARNLGCDAFELKAELLGRSFVETRNVLHRLRGEQTRIAVEAKRIDDLRKSELEHGKVPDTELLLSQTQNIVIDDDLIKDTIESAEARLGRLRSSLNKMDNMGELFSESSDAEVMSLIEGLVDDSPQRNAILPIIQLHIEWINRLGIERSFHGAVLKEARVIAGTCIGLGSTPAFHQDRFDLCIIDEASKATATEALVPISRSERSILVGDPQQLPPYVESGGEDGDISFTDDAKKSLLSLLLERLPRENVEELNEQRRMCASIGDLVSEIFYDSKLVNIRTDSERIKHIVKLYPKAVTWVSTTKKGFSEQRTAEKSYKNEGEAQVVLEELRKIARETRGKKEKTDVAVIAAYSAQVAFLRDLVDQQIGVHPGFAVEINTVDAFQGREADICIYSVTRSNDNRNIGFQRERKRLNVALSRARDALILIGDAEFCSKLKGQNYFGTVLNYIDSHPDFCEKRNYDSK